NCDQGNKHFRFKKPFQYWCGRGDLNPHAFRRHPLKMVCLPVPPLPLCCAAPIQWSTRNREGSQTRGNLDYSKPQVTRRDRPGTPFTLAELVPSRQNPAC